MNPLARYARWLHTRWPAGVVEKLPRVAADGSTTVPGLYVVGDLTGVPLLKFSADSGARAVRTILADPRFRRRDGKDDVLDLVIVGAGISGMAAALEARKAALRFEILEASEPFSTIVDFPRGKPIYAYPTAMTPAGELRFTADVKERLVEELREQTLDRGIQPRIVRAERVARRKDLLEVVLAEGETIRAQRVIVAIGRSGNFRKLGVPGEDLGKVYNRLHDPKDFCDRNVLVVGGGDSALETAVALTECGAHVTLSYRKPEFSRPKPENIEKIRRLAADPGADVQVEQPVSDRVTTAVGDYLGEARRPGSLRLLMNSRPTEIREKEVVILRGDGRKEALPNDVVFRMIGREAPLEFFRRSGVPIRGERRAGFWIGFLLFLLFSAWLYHWKSPDTIPFGLHLPPWLNPDPAKLSRALLDSGRAWVSTPGTLGHTLAVSAGGRSFYYTLAYCLLVVIFGIRRIRRRRTPYVTAQTLVLMAVQCLPLFLLPEIFLPWIGENGGFDAGFGRNFADLFFPIVDYGHGREYWRAYGFVLAWPLMAWNWFTSEPLWGWLVVGTLQTFVLIPLLIRRWGKGAYCGWICSCGALAETLGDTHRRKMPHGPFWNRLNMVGQVFLGFAFVLLVLRILGWIGIGWAEAAFLRGAKEVPLLNYRWMVDLFWAGILGLGAYFFFSGRVWCRFACPLAALMHIYTRWFSRFRIFAEKKKCISCNICTSVCHQGIDIMNFANKGFAMEDPQCVRCSACVESCPTGVLAFGRADRDGKIAALDRLAAAPRDPAP